MLSSVTFDSGSGDLAIDLGGSDSATAQVTSDNKVQISINGWPADEMPDTSDVYSITVTAGDGGHLIDLSGLQPVDFPYIPIFATITTGAGDDTVTGTGMMDTIDVGDGNDQVDGLDGDDHITGGLGDDTLSGGAGADSIFGGDDNDDLWSGSGDPDGGTPSLDGGEGDDQIDGNMDLAPDTDMDTVPSIATPGLIVGIEGDIYSSYITLDGNQKRQISLISPDLDETYTWTASGLPEGLAIDAVTGEILGTIAYSAHDDAPTNGPHGRQYEVSVAVSDTSGWSDSVDFEWPVLDAQITTLRATEFTETGTPVHSATQGPGMTTNLLYVIAGHSVTISVSQYALGALTRMPHPDHTFYYVRRNTGGTYDSGTLTGTASSMGDRPNSLSFSIDSIPDGGPLTIQIGYDQDLDGVNELSEITHQSTLPILGLSSAKIKSRRVANGPVELPFPVLENEFYEAAQSEPGELSGGVFEFSVSGPLIGDHPLLKLQILDQDGSERTIAEQAGESLQLQFNTADDIGSAKMVAFIDHNANDNHDTGEPLLQSPAFQIKQLRIIELDVDNPSNTPTGVPFLTSSFTAGSDILIRKDGADDFRAPVKIVMRQVTMYTPSSSADRPDIVWTGIPNDISGHLESASDVVIVGSIEDAVGMTVDNDKILLVRRTDPVDFGRTLVHELGHRAGLDHDGHGSGFLMKTGPTSSGDVKLLQADSSAYCELD